MHMPLASSRNRPRRPVRPRKVLCAFSMPPRKLPRARQPPAGAAPSAAELEVSTIEPPVGLAAALLPLTCLSQSQPVHMAAPQDGAAEAAVHQLENNFSIPESAGPAAESVNEAQLAQLPSPEAALPPTPPQSAEPAIDDELLLETECEELLLAEDAEPTPAPEDSREPPAEAAVAAPATTSDPATAVTATVTTPAPSRITKHAAKPGAKYGAWRVAPPMAAPASHARTGSTLHRGGPDRRYQRPRDLPYAPRLPPAGSTQGAAMCTCSSQP